MGDIRLVFVLCLLILLGVVLLLLGVGINTT
jgi:hypothetical protein